MTQSSEVPATGKPRWYVPAPATFLCVILLMQGVLFLSAHFGWFWFNEQKGHTVLITLAATAVCLLLITGWVFVSRFFGTKSQFSLATLLLMVPVMAMPCGWLASEMERARRQRAFVEMAPPRGQIIYRRASVSNAWLITTFGKDFFSELHGLDLRNLNVSDSDVEQLSKLTQLHTLHLSGTQITDAGLEHLKKLKSLERLGLYETKVSDAGIEHLKEMSELRYLFLNDTQVTEAGVRELKAALPKCFITH